MHSSTEDEDHTRNTGHAETAKHRSLHKESVCPDGIHHEHAPCGQQQGMFCVLCATQGCCLAAHWPDPTRATAPLPSLRTSLPSYNIKSLTLCACILGNLPPTMGRDLASEWEENSALERQSKGEWNRGKWKHGLKAEQQREKKERATTFVAHRRAGKN